MKICFLGAGSTVFAKNVLGDCIRTPELGNFEIALHDIDLRRLEDSYNVVSAINNKYGKPATIVQYPNRREALTGASYAINAIQVGGYKPGTVTDFEVPKKYGLRQTIADTLGIGGIFRALRTIAVLQDFAKDIEEVCPDALFLNYTNPMAMLTGYLLTYTKVKAVGLCHSVQGCVPWLLRSLRMSKELPTCTYSIGGINHQAWLLDIHDKNGKDLYPEIKARSLAREDNNRLVGIVPDMVRHYMMHNFGCYITESSEHTSEYLPYFIKDRRPDLIKKFHIPLDEYPRRCIRQIKHWKFRRFTLTFRKKLYHHKSHEYGSRIISGAHTKQGFNFNGSILNKGYLIPNLPEYACVEIPLTVTPEGFQAQPFQRIPDQLAALNRTNINAQTMAIRAAHERSMDLLYIAAALDPHTSSELTIAQIKNLCDDLYEAHKKDGLLPEYK